MMRTGTKRFSTSRRKNACSFAVIVLFLSLVSLNGCSLFSSSDNSAASTDNDQSVSPDVKSKQQELQSLKTEKAGLEDTKKSVEKDFNESKERCKVKTGKPYEKNNKCSITEGLEKDYIAASNKVAEIDNRIANADKSLENAKAQAKSKPPAGEASPVTTDPSASSSGGLLNALPRVLLVLAILVIIALLVLIFLILRSEVSKANGMLDTTLRRLDKQKQLSEEGIKQIGALRESVSVLQTDVRNIGKSTPSGKRENRSKSSPSIGAMRGQDDLDQSLKEDFGYPTSEPEPFFPISVEALTERLGHDSLVVESELATGNFVEDRAGHFLLITDPLPPHDFCIVPRLKKVQTQNEYFTHYSNYYTCQNPSGGEINIIKPATGTRVDGGWKLKDKGELEIS